MNLIIVVQIRK